MFERNGQKLGSVLVDREVEPSAEPESDGTQVVYAGYLQQDTSEVDSGETTEVKPSMALTKDELVDLAEKARLGERTDLEQFTKQELVDELNANEGEG